MSTETPTPETYVDFAVAQYLSRLDHTVQRIRDLADEVDRRGREDLTNGEHLIGSQRHRPASRAASRAVHAFTWGIANSNIDSLIDAAAEVDRASGEAGTS